MADRAPQVISLSLTSPEDMFVLAQTDQPWPRADRALLASDPIEDGLNERIGRTLARYCDHRIAYNERERRAVRLDGVFSLWIGIPIVVLGFLLVIVKSSIVGAAGNANLVLDSGGWVLVWVGLWFPLDTLLFTPLSYGRGEPRVGRLRGASVVVERTPP